VARILARFARIQQSARDQHARGANLSDILGERGGARFPLGFNIEGRQVKFSFAECGDPSLRTVPIYLDPLSKLRYFFAELPIEYLHHDDRINPRNIGANLSELVTAGGRSFMSRWGGSKPAPRHLW
jgi:hypothetical protein